MARKKNNKNKGRKRRKQNKPRMLSLGPTYPNSLLAKHKLNFSFDLSQLYSSDQIGTTNLRSFILNGMYDTDTAVGAGSGHQPRFFDEMSVIYNTYRVIGAKARLKFINLSSEPCYVHTVVGNQQLADSEGWTNNTLGEVKGIRSRIVHAVNTGSQSVVSMNIGYSPEAVEGKPKSAIRGDPSFEALFSHNPLEPHYLSIAMSQVSSTLGANAVANVKCEIELDFTAIWNDRKIHTVGS